MTSGRVKEWFDEEGWGVLSSPEVPGDLFTHFSMLEMDGYRSLEVGQQVRFEWEPAPSGQDGYYYVARQVRVDAAAGDGRS
jgi:cold shock protein